MRLNDLVNINQNIKNIRNFAIIAHIDHGKSTLSDRIISICGGLTDREMKEQVLDSLNVERERGITVKAQSVSLEFKHDGEIYTLNLIDTPGHVDFSYEVRRSLGACEGAIVLVDATQGVQAQTLANVRTARDNNVVLIPVMNKIDLPSSEPLHVAEQIHDLLHIETEPMMVSAKTGDGVTEMLVSLINTVPAPKGSADTDLQALIVDSWYDQHIGIIILAKIVNGVAVPRMNIRFMNHNKEYRVNSVGVFTPKKVELPKLSAGMTGYIIASIREIKDCAPGDTIGEVGKPCEKLPGFVEMKPSVFCGIYPTSQDEYANLKRALEKLRLNDGALTIENSNVPVLGTGFRCGFLGLLHLEVVQQRLVEEFGVEIISTAPSVVYKVFTHGGEELEVEHPSELPDMSKVAYIAEPFAHVSVFIDYQFIGTAVELCKSKRGEEIDGTEYLQQISEDRYVLHYSIPLSEIIYDFHDKLKSITQGYGSFDYELAEYRRSDIVPLTILVEGKPVEALGSMIHKDNALFYGRWVCEQLKESIDRMLFPVAVQAAIGGKIIARETVPATRKDVTAKCYGGDITRKKKLLEKQKEGKAKLKMMAGDVSVPKQKMLDIMMRRKPSK